MASKVAPLLTLSLLLLFAVAAHGCVAPYCPGGRRCPMDALKLGVCAGVLNGLVSVKIGPGGDDCCSLLGTLADLDAAVCLCTLKLPIDISIVFNACRRSYPSGFTCY
ncbi:hypothetical protein E2562_006081 [Oryza meyeriana var. granulata]|uniref:Bifunctional inhibitor/plant lipid transfer protein/seed storage helical domain-containing protein n=1 Tax=Oryza meyeriana var. granulata TaxID=110450 RepID=A0A6G1EVG7_9ORYZ|nr:hypothetical protein E2562_006081 [Oryza meyeriana var. granulata]